MDGMRFSDPGVASQLPKWLDHPAFSALLSGIEFTVGSKPLGRSIAFLPPRTIIVDREWRPCLQNLVIFRLALEFAWLRTVPGLDEDAALLLAGRAAAGFMVCVRGYTKSAHDDGELFCAVYTCGENHPGPSDLQVALDHLRPLNFASGSVRRPIESFGTTYLRVMSLWSLTRSAESLLISGGDERLSLDDIDGVNRYGCSPFPETDVIDLASSTASGITTDTLDAVEAARQELFRTASSVGEDCAVEEFSTALRHRILSHFGAEETAECLLAASGTDAALLTTYLLRKLSPEGCLNSILMSPSETGSGVPQAVLGRHFAGCTASRIGVGKDSPVAVQFADSHLQTISARQDDCTPRAAEAIEHDCLAAVERGLETGPVILHALQGSKTGLVVPNRHFIEQLSTTYDARFHVVIDACQLRCNPDRIKEFIQDGYIVLITGSKFFSAPGFCGAVLMPKNKYRRIMQAAGDMAGLWPYATFLNGIVQRRCPGLILRWTAALYCMDRFSTISQASKDAYLSQAEKHLLRVFAKQTRFRLTETSSGEISDEPGERSIFTFRIRGASDFLTFDDLRCLYERASKPRRAHSDGTLRGTNRVRFGQPVRLGDSGAAGLRVAISARHIFDGVNLEPEFEAAFAELSSLVDTI